MDIKSQDHIIFSILFVSILFVKHQRIAIVIFKDGSPILDLGKMTVDIFGGKAFVFKLKNLPEGTNKVVFKLKDLDVPQYNHGGGTVKLSSGGTMPGGVFKYKSPCPPDGPHTYEWTATAKKGGKTLAKASASKVYPK
jgi:phosphatidylethanolamine-binding protein (PEBP) family uncharacterized protein